MEDLIKRFTETFGVSGYEEEIRAAIREEIAGLVDEVRVDALGSLLALRRGSGAGKRVMLAAHMDQIGLMVTHVEEKGYLRFASVGALFPLSCWGSQVRFRDGTVGTIGLDGRADPQKAPALADMYVDVGATSKAEVAQRVGDIAAFFRPFAGQGNAWFAPNMDDRIGCAMLAQLLRDLKGKDIAHDLYAVFTSQEEVGTRGAGASAFAVEPEVAIALDVTSTNDTPHARGLIATVCLGGGPAIKVKDAGMIGHPGLNRLLEAAADAAGVTYQREVMLMGSTDAMSMQLVHGGVPASAISAPSRYVHTPSQIVDRRDAEGGVRLLAEFLSRPIEL